MEYISKTVTLKNEKNTLIHRFVMQIGAEVMHD